MLPIRARLLVAAVLTLGASSAAVAAPPTTSDSRVVQGSQGWLYTAQDWSVPCQYAGQSAATAGRMADLVAALERSGRPALVVLGPDKGSLVTGHLPAGVPRRACAEREKKAVWAAASERLGSRLVDLRRDLTGTASRHQVYWRKDTHWTPTAGTVLARRLAARYDPLLQRSLGTRATTCSRRGDLARVSGRPDAEQIACLALTAPDVTVRELARGHAGVGMGSRHTTATPGPRGRVVPGRTLFLADSFTFVSLASLAPLFEDAVYLWPDDRSRAEDLVAAVQAADRVVVGRVERFTARWRPYDADVVRAMATLTPRLPGPTRVRADSVP